MSSDTLPDGHMYGVLGIHDVLTYAITEFTGQSK